MKTYFITGGDGFIGYFVTLNLLKNENNKVVIYDSHKHYIPLEKSDWFKYQQYRIKSLEKFGERVVRIRGDTTDRGLLRKSIQDYTPDTIIHLAAVPIASISNDFPEEARVNILEGTITLMDIVRELGLKSTRVLYTSSSMVYGDFMRDPEGNIIPAKEEQSCNPVGIYGAMKLAGEHIVKVYNKRFGIPYIIIRPSAIYGPTDCNRRVTEIFVKNALNGKELILDNGGLHQLDFSYIKDVAQGFVLAADSPEGINQTFNITRGKGRTIKEFSEIIKKYIPDLIVTSKSVEVFRPNRGALDISKARRLLGYEPKYDIEDGVKEYIDFLRG